MPPPPIEQPGRPSGSGRIVLIRDGVVVVPPAEEEPQGHEPEAAVQGGPCTPGYDSQPLGSAARTMGRN